MATTPTPPVFGNLPQFKFDIPQPGNWGVGDIAKLVQTPPQSYVNTVLPSMADILGTQSQYAAPQIAAIRGRGEELAAGAQSDAMKRGLTGSDIEAAGMLGARQGAATEEAQLRGNIAMQQAQTMAAALMQAYGYDIQANQAMFQNLAQLIGQELTAKREMDMFQQSLSAKKESSAAAGKSSLWGAGIGALGTVGGAALGAYFGQPAAGAAIGGSLGNSLSDTKA